MSATDSMPKKKTPSVEVYRYDQGLKGLTANWITR